MFQEVVDISKLKGNHMSNTLPSDKSDKRQPGEFISQQICYGMNLISPVNLSIESLQEKYDAVIDQAQNHPGELILMMSLLFPDDFCSNGHVPNIQRVFRLARLNQHIESSDDGYIKLADEFAEFNWSGWDLSKRQMPFYVGRFEIEQSITSLEIIPRSPSAEPLRQFFIGNENVDKWCSQHGANDAMIFAAMQDVIAVNTDVKPN